MYSQQYFTSEDSVCFSRGSSDARRSYHLVKRPLDLSLVLLASPVVIPLILILALLIALDGGKPFYSQTRIGRNGRAYRMWKLRSMVHDADERLLSFLVANPGARNEWDLTQKLHDDPRVTRFGRILRACSLDELPQLWNVIRGDMSLIGPRPMLPGQQSLYEGRAYYRLRPGLTGLWQVSARNRSSFAARVAYDERYEDEMGLMSDLRILIQTVLVVLRRTGC